MQGIQISLPNHFRSCSCTYVLYDAKWNVFTRPLPRLGSEWATYIDNDNVNEIHDGCMVHKPLNFGLSDHIDNPLAIDRHGSEFNLCAACSSKCLIFFKFMKNGKNRFQINHVQFSSYANPNINGFQFHGIRRQNWPKFLKTNI